MDGLNRFLILLLLLALLYALYRYQQQLTENESPTTGKVEVTQQANNQKQRPGRELIDMDSIENISLNNVSQISLGSLDDDCSVGYKQDSALDSIDSEGSFSLLDDNSRGSKESLDTNFFFR